MADNIKSIPFSSDDEGIDFVQQARDAVVEATAKTDGLSALRLDEIYVVWFSFVRRNWKAMLSSSRPDGRIYEVSYKPDNDGSDGPESLVVDVYYKGYNIVLKGD